MPKQFKIGDKVKVYLKKSDFDRWANDYTFNYSNQKDCPLARAVKRKFKIEKYVTVYNFDNGVDIKSQHWSNKGEWNLAIANKVGECLHNGDKTNYYVTLTLESN